MGVLASVVGVAILALAAPALVAPRRFAGWVGGWGGVPIGALVALRLAVAVALWLAAPDCRHPTAVQVMAGLSLVGAALGLALGQRRIAAWLRWWAASPPAWIRAWGVATAILGGFLIHTSL